MSAASELKSDGPRVEPTDEGTQKELEAAAALPLSLNTVLLQEEAVLDSPTSIYSTSPAYYLAFDYQLSPGSQPTSMPSSPIQVSPSAPPPTPTTSNTRLGVTLDTITTELIMPEHPPCLQVRDPAFLANFFTSMSSSEESTPTWIKEEAETRQREETYAWLNSKVNEIKEEFTSQNGALKELFNVDSAAMANAASMIVNRMDTIIDGQKLIIDAQKLSLEGQEIQMSLLKNAIDANKGFRSRVVMSWNEYRRLRRISGAGKRKSRWSLFGSNRGKRETDTRPSELPAHDVGEKESETASEDLEIAKGLHEGSEDGSASIDKASADETGTGIQDCSIGGGGSKVPDI